MDKMSFVDFMNYISNKVNNASNEELDNMYANDCFNISFQNKTCSIQFDAQSFNCIMEALDNMKNECDDC